MSLWEAFTWFNVGVLALGSVIVFALFLRQVGSLLPPRERKGSKGDVGSRRDA